MDQDVYEKRIDFKRQIKTVNRTAMPRTARLRSKNVFEN